MLALHGFPALLSIEQGPSSVTEEPTSNTPAEGPVGEPEQVLVLTALSTGRWLIETNSQHVFDLDQGTYQRLPRPGRGSFAHDNAVVRLTRVDRWPEVGNGFFIWFDDPERPQTTEHWRQSSLIHSITRVAEQPEVDALPAG